jgi:hypothetical protein
LLLSLFLGCAQLVGGVASEAGAPTREDATAMRDADDAPSRRDDLPPTDAPPDPWGRCLANAPPAPTFVDGFPGGPDDVIEHALDPADAPPVEVPASARGCVDAWLRPMLLRVTPSSGEAFMLRSAQQWQLAAVDPCDGRLLACAQTTLDVPSRPDARPVLLVVGPAIVRDAPRGQNRIEVLRLQRAGSADVGDDCNAFGERGPRCGVGLQCTPAGSRGGRTGICIRATDNQVCGAGGPSCGASSVCRRGRCATVFAAWKRCLDATSRCVDGFACLPWDDEEFRCLPRGEIGAPCRFDGTSDACAPGLACTYAGCAPPTPRGGRCGAEGLRGPCAEGLACVDGICDVAGIEGARCGYDIGACLAGLACDARGRCVRATQQPGDPCNLEAGLLCRRPAACNEGRCIGDARMFCRNDADCAVGWSCLGNACTPGPAPIFCRAQRPYCEGDRRCDGEVCQRSACTPACREGERCAERCVGTGSQEGTCRPETAAVACEPGLACSATLVCMSARSEGESCGAGGQICREGLSCVHDGREIRCARRGTLGAECRVREGRLTCDAGLVCQGGSRCVEANLPENASCPSDAPSVCATGLTCEQGSNRMFCASAGSRFGRCRAAAPRCNKGLACIAHTRDYAQCLDVFTDGETCPAQLFPCAAGLVCTRENGRQTRCRPGVAGAVNARCRDSDPFCDEGLYCDENRFCAARIPRGGACRSTASCQVGHLCIEGTCRAPGGEDAPCRDAAPRCDAGLACLGRRCVRPLPGAPCMRASDCVEGDLCVLGRCRGLGAVSGERCRLTGEACASGLFCDLSRRCRAVRAVGARCVADEGPCDEGVSCVVRSGEGRCAPVGSAFARCRVDGSPTCDAGLQCSEQRVCLPPA